LPEYNGSEGKGQGYRKGPPPANPLPGKAQRGERSCDTADEDEPRSMKAGFAELPGTLLGNSTYA